MTTTGTAVTSAVIGVRIEEKELESILAFVRAWHHWHLTKRPPGLPMAVYDAANQMAEMWRHGPDGTTP
jgi:hypothetical protein